MTDDKRRKEAREIARKIELRLPLVTNITGQDARIKYIENALLDYGDKRAAEATKAERVRCAEIARQHGIQKYGICDKTTPFYYLEREILAATDKDSPKEGQ